LLLEKFQYNKKILGVMFMGYLICSKCKGYYKLKSGESPKDFISECDCGGKIRYIENLDIVDPQWKPVTITKKKTQKEIFSEKIKTVTKVPQELKNRFQQFMKRYNNRLYRARNQRRINRNPQGMDMANIQSILNELNFKNIRWIIVIPPAIAITLILAYAPSIFTLLTFPLLAAVGFLFSNHLISAKNAAITGAISFFIGCLLTGSYLYLIPYAILGLINGAVCGWIGGYIRTKI
jgi:hypothetical protein